MTVTFQIGLFPQLGLLSTGRHGMTDKDFIPPVILAPQPPFRLCFMDLITGGSGTDLLRFRGEAIRDVCIISELSDCPGMIIEVISYCTSTEQGFGIFTLSHYDRAMRRPRGELKWLFGSFVHSGTQVKRQAQEFWFHKSLIHAMRWLRGEAMTPLSRNSTGPKAFITQFSTLFQPAKSERCLEPLQITSILSMCRITLPLPLPMISQKSWPGCHPWSPRCDIRIFASRGWIA